MQIQTGSLKGISFGKKYEPCKSFFKKAQAIWTGRSRSEEPNARNVGVTITANHPGIGSGGGATSTPYTKDHVSQITMATDASALQVLDPETLEPVGVAEQTTLHADLKGPLSAAHAEHDPETGDIFNHNLDLGRTGTYRVFRTSAATGKTSVLATFAHTPAYIHSQFLTENYYIICVWNSSYSMGGASILWKRSLMEAMAWDGSNPATWFVIDKTSPENGGKGIIAKFESDPFFCFHTINAYEETVGGKTHVVADLAGYADMTVLDKFYVGILSMAMNLSLTKSQFENMLSDSPKAAKWADASNSRARPTYRRYRLSDVPSSPTKSTRRAELEYESPHGSAVELPTINGKFNTKPYRYVYGITDTGLSTFADGLIKYDTKTHETKVWRVHGHTAGEAIFIPDPESTEEDGGVLLTVVLDGFEGKSYLLVLDARSLETIAKAHVDGVVGMAFHGLYTPKARL
jgi:torulene dioxygenase